MTWGLDDLFALFALLLVVEGLLPAISPDHWRKMLYRFASYNDYSVRLMGLMSMISGAALLAIVHNWDVIVETLPQMTM